jgi:dihydroxyacid dehydratase/phosphogluconate dehydratase
VRIPEKVVAELVQEASVKMSDGSYVQTQVGTFVQTQPAAAKYLTAHVKELGGAEAVVNAVFHASLLSACFLRHSGRSVRRMTFEELDAVSGQDRDGRLRRVQPALADYIEANVEQAEMRKVLVLIVLGMDYVF